jgi:hypothetical protein
VWGTVWLIFCCITECAIFTGISLCLLKLQLCFMIPSCNWCANRLPVPTGVQINPFFVAAGVQLVPFVATVV